MTNWLDPATVKAALNPNDWVDQTSAEMSVGLCVLEAIADLPVPPNVCDMCGTGPGSSMHYSKGLHPMSESVLHRIWRIARIVCGKEPCQTCGRPGCEGTHMVPDPRIIRKEEGREG